ncbi:MULTISPECIES: S-adenosylmethionine:tRNA ribosyltransferase-isomerase [unclassified Streptomyces]|uniref:S-adenosylmethionine:tRNA ribosyltransferase-isomerase n=1 Tax=unclassified Streptomyces TaxID=2593676 RepID=UPI00048E8422|nr:S-adenosylmethionine:tRNA ribosyltransferase-isomerase [Streptomyces sp. SolWspMP-sol2th]
MSAVDAVRRDRSSGAPADAGCGEGPGALSLEALRVPPELSARVPAEQRGSGRDDVRLLVTRGTEVSHHTFRELPGQVRAGDVLVVNTSATLPAAVNGRVGGERVVVHFSTRGEDGRWAVELRAPGGSGATGPRPGGPAGAVVRLPGGRELVLEEPMGGVLSAGNALPTSRSRRTPGHTPALAPGGTEAGPAEAGAGEAAGAVEAGPSEAGAVGRGTVEAGATEVGAVEGGTVEAGAGARGAVDRGPFGAGPASGARLWWARVPEGVPGLLRRYGRPIRYGYTERDQPLSAYQTVFAVAAPDGSGSAEMPSAARPFTAALVAELVSRGVQFAPLSLDTGVASAEAHEPPYPERFSVPPTTAWLVNAARAAGGRVIAVGTTAVRALESAVDAAGVVRPVSGWTDLVVTPRRGVRVVDGLLTGLHEPEASHLLMLEAVAGREALRRGYEAALERRYLWHEFGDVHLLLPDEERNAPDCSSNVK